MNQNKMSQSKNWGHIGKPAIFLLLLYIGAAIFTIGLMVMLKNEDDGLPLFIIGLIILFAAGICFLVLFYQVWRFVINGLKSYGRIPSIKSPGRAVGFLFIPIYSLYWMFKAYGSFAGDFNSLSKMSGSDLMMPEGLGTFIPILIIIGIFPYVNLVAGPLNSFILIPCFMGIAAGNCRKLSRESTRNV